jgi:aspartyl-tRNA(Asn)/glutamyl-tRNA(Gln) amidotransferase subunit A
MIEVNQKGGIGPAEAYRFHEKLGTDIEKYDRIVRDRVLGGRTITNADYQDMLTARQTIIQAFDKAHADVDVIVCPTLPTIASEIRELEANPETLRRVNSLFLRNPSVVNFLDRCALSVPCHENGNPPVGLMLIGKRMQDKSLLSIGLAVERALADSKAG